VRPVVEGIGPIKAIRALERSEGLFLLPGDIRLADLESELTGFWNEAVQRKVRGFRGTAALSTLVNLTAEAVKPDVIFYDSGPNIGALNRAILLDCDFFAVPAAADLFSIRAIKTLGHTLAQWVSSWRVISELAPDSYDCLPGKPKLLGYIPQRFKTYGNKPASNYKALFGRIERAVGEEVLSVLRSIDPELGSAATPPLNLGEIKEFGALANTSQQQGVPIAVVKAGTPEQRGVAETVFRSLAEAILRKISLGR
jgi:cellulose biosynthesis protein BcsQ